MGLSKIILPISHTKNLISTYLFIMKKGENMKKLGLVLGILAMLGSNAIAGYSSCTTTCYGNSCTTYCYDY